jgi:hypothetical protein
MEEVMSKRAVAMGIIFVTATCLFTGCIDNDQSLTIVGVVAPTAGCTWQIDPDQWWARGTLDLAFWSEQNLVENPTYVLLPQIHNNMPNNSDCTNKQLNTMSVRLEKATITFEWLYGRDEVGTLQALEEMEETIYLAGTVDAAADEGGDSGKMVIGMEAIPYQVGGMLTSLGEDTAKGVVLGLGIEVHGTTLGGSEMSSNKFVFPVYMCWGCLAVNPATYGYTCCSDAPDQYYPSCIPGQDEIFLPCSCMEVTP